MTQQESCSEQRIRSSDRPRHVPYTRYGLQSASDVVSVRLRRDGLLDLTEKAPSYDTYQQNSGRH